MSRLFALLLAPALANLRKEGSGISVTGTSHVTKPTEWKDSQRKLAQPAEMKDGATRNRISQKKKEEKLLSSESHIEAAAREKRLLKEISSKMSLPGPGLLNVTKSRNRERTFAVNQSYSQIQQDLHIDKLLRNMTNGFVVEAGANDGLTFSNSLFFEVTRNWRCLLVEPNPWDYQKLVSYEGNWQIRRKCYSINAGLALDAKGGELDFLALGLTGGFKKGYQDQKMLEKLEKETERKKIIKVMTYPLDLILRSLHVRTVDYLSLDTEGSEDAVLASVNFNATEIGVITVEINDESAKMKRIDKIMHAENFLRLNHTKFPKDAYYANRAYFKKRGISLAGLRDRDWEWQQQDLAPLE